MKRTIFKFLPVLYAVVFLVYCNHDNIVSPPPAPAVVVSSVTPNEIAEGAQDIKITIDGSGFTGTSTVDLGPNITFLDQQIPDSQHINLKIRLQKNAQPGKRTVIVNTGTAIGQLPDGFTIEKNLLPIADFTVDPTSGTQNVNYSFDASASTDKDGDIVRYDWDFGDGKTARGEKVKHKYAQGGDFKVSLTVTDSASAQSTTRKKLKVTFFDQGQAENDINDVLVGFLRLFGQIETLSADEITVGFSDNPSCPGKAHEMFTINQEKQTIQEAFVEVYAPSTITQINETTAHAWLAARFYGTYTDGTKYDGVGTHFFYLVNESTGWRICDYTLQKN